MGLHPESLIAVEIERSATRLREILPDLEAIKAALRSLGARDERVKQQADALSVWMLSYLNEVNLLKSNMGAARMLGAVTPEVKVADMPLHPSNHNDGLLPGAKRWDDGERFQDSKKAAANDHS